MALTGRFLVLMLCASISGAVSVFQPISSSHLSAALELFRPVNGSFGSLEETYKALRTFEVLGIEKKPDVSVSKPMSSSSLILRDMLEIGGLLNCSINKENLEDTLSRFTVAINSASSLIEKVNKTLRAIEVFGLEEKHNVTVAGCKSVLEALGSSSTSLGDIFYGLKVNGILNCNVDAEIFEDTISRLKIAVSEAESLMDLYYSIGSLVLIKEQTSLVNLHLNDPEEIFHTVLALSRINSQWDNSSSIPESGTFAAGIALQTLAGVVSIASIIFDQSMVDQLTSDIVKLFDGIEQYDDGAFYFDEKHIDEHENQGIISTTSSVVRGLTTFAAVTEMNLDLFGDKMLGLAKFFLGVRVPGDADDFYNQIDSLACLERNRDSVALIISLSSMVLSLTKKDSLKVEVTTALGSNPPPLTLKLVGVFSSNSKDVSIIGTQELMLNVETGSYTLNNLPDSIDVGSYLFVFEIVLHESSHGKAYATGSQTIVPIFVTGFIRIENAEIAVQNRNLKNIETQKLDLSEKQVVSLSANHLQKLRLSFQLTTPAGQNFLPHQAFLKLKHESMLEHIFVVGSSGKQFEIVLDFQELVENFFYLSGRYDMELVVGDAVMENSLLQVLGHVELDLPEPLENAPLPPPPPSDPYSRYGPKEEINYISRDNETVQREYWFTGPFFALAFVPNYVFIVTVIGNYRNNDPSMRNFPTELVPAIHAVLFQVGIGAVLLVYAIKLDLLKTLKIVCLLGVFLVLIGRRVLSYRMKIRLTREKKKLCLQGRCR